ncbi:MAG: DUF378 domain-containing protein [candidate division WS1 bacterium]|jgi:uncharacterized membrane protein YuzA (DUF378 family)|nr:DUF378 domain-containing protein [candidate division WS1 bacterium]
MRTLNTIVLILLIVGGINWGLVALADFDLVASIFGDGTIGQAGVAGTIVYVLVALAAIWAISWFGIFAESHRTAHGPMAAEQH